MQDVCFLYCCHSSPIIKAEQLANSDSQTEGGLEEVLTHSSLAPPPDRAEPLPLVGR